MRKEELAPWEIEHLKQEHEEKLMQQRTRFTRRQWVERFRRRVVVRNEDAARIITTARGNTLHLFSEAQTVPLKEVTYVD
ncbi:MAG TPA: hypothetical protein VMP68_14505 [Candidatus Eisenbacteria bacterium]|nr:hypothetical protein [Candidatus Eisenbacteria bacterium]